MSLLKRLKAEFQRRVIIDLLADDPTDALSVHLLSAALANFGQDVLIGEMIAHANWLAGEELVDVVHRGHPMVLRIADRGRAVAEGSIHVDGVARPMR